MPSNDSADQAIEDRRWKAWDLRVKGKSYRAIGDELGVSGKTAHQDIHAVLERITSETNETASHDRTVQLARLDRALDTVESALSAEVFDNLGNKDHELQLKALDRMLKIEERRAKLLGLDAPSKVDATVASVTLEDLDARKKTADANESGDGSSG